MTHANIKTTTGAATPPRPRHTVAASPTPHQLVGQDGDVDTLITAIKRAIRQGLID
jgi:hypothetical protein